ncbi:hypothetical protein LMG26411_05723 [Cupriavidus numazuensis]|uniref:UspA domain-containing protein n=1 Tax=Cupriavidus numazuensis TaxID=221992 RepID=A0ABM8TQ39_9BURK|nr:universal stress protein [Cupriavidus numazuensis]CAG2157854.1 hypothetical protein LMG26411_05723 [Cupriavidus numazuensis]
MACGSIFVYADKDPAAQRRFQLAAQLAHKNASPLVAMLAGFVPDPMWFYLMNSPQAIVEQDQKLRRQAWDTARSSLQVVADTAQVAVEWRTAELDAVSEALQASREAGLIVAGQYDSSNIEGPIAGEILEALILESGRPVLVVPQAGQFPTMGTRALIAWNGSREAARALHDALPWIAGACARVVCARTDTDPRPDATPVAHAMRVLERQGMRVEVETCASGSDISVGELLLSRAADFGADLIVMGAYGHGRMRELVLGGVTRALLASMTVPVLFSH